jgi:hypothetical protein
MFNKKLTRFNPNEDQKLTRFILWDGAQAMRMSMLLKRSTKDNGAASTFIGVGG